MDITVYSDESGTFDKAHQDIFVFGGLIFTSEEQRNKQASKYRAAEAGIRNALASKGQNVPTELKASCLPVPMRKRLFKATNIGFRFGVIVHLKLLIKSDIFLTSQNKQRYQDYAYKRGLKHALRCLIQQNQLDPQEEHTLYITADEHTIATSGKYNLQQTIMSEFAYGVYHPDYGTEHAPILPKLKTTTVTFADSTTNVLVRAADIIANRVYRRYLCHEDLTKGGITILHLP